MTKGTFAWALEQFKAGRTVYRKFSKQEITYSLAMGDAAGMFDEDDRAHTGWYTKPEQLTLPFVDMEHGKL
jgi:hypothetical protein